MSVSSKQKYLHVTQVPPFFVTRSKVAAGSEDTNFPHQKSKVLLGFHVLVVGRYAVALGLEHDC